MKILIVDDYESIRVMLKDMLRQINMTQVSEASNGEEALKMIQAAYQAREPYDLVFSDWNMPGMDGLELLKFVKKTPGLSGLPFILVTTESDKDAMFDALTSGATDYVVKPFSVFTLKSKIEKCLQKLRKTG